MELRSFIIIFTSTPIPNIEASCIPRALEAIDWQAMPVYRDTCVTENQLQHLEEVMMLLSCLTSNDCIAVGFRLCLYLHIMIELERE